MRKNFYTTALLALLSIIGFGQDIPTSPEAWAFQNFTEYRLNNSTGVPDISIPLYTIKHKGFEIPLHLSYNYQGVRNGYNFDVYGLGWNLSGRGKVTRSVNDLPDEEYDFVYEDAHTYLNNYSLGIPEFYADVKFHDFTPDEFHAILPNGKSFSFFIEKETGSYVVYSSAKNKYKVEFTIFSKRITKFTITDEFGVKYTFGDYINSPAGCNIIYDHNIEWNITQIDLPNSNLPITFTYGESISVFYNKTTVPTLGLSLWYGNTTHSCNDNTIFDYQNITLDHSVCQVQLQQSILTSIHYGETEIEFLFESYDKDMYQASWLKQMNIYYDNVLKKQYDFKINPYQNVLDPPICKLDKVTENSINTSLTKEHTFGYEDLYKRPPIQGTNSEDHWGYFSEGSSAITSDWFVDVFGLGIDQNEQYYDDFYMGQDGAWCQINLNNLNSLEPIKQTMGDLNKIVYPTGGYTTFTFEGNLYDSHWSHGIAEGTGYRIGFIRNYSAAGEIITENEYLYGDDDEMSPDHLGLGIAPVEPSPITFLTLKATDYMLNEIGGLEVPTRDDYHTSTTSKSVPNSSFNSVTDNFYHYSFSAGTFRSLLGGQPPIVYPNIKIIKRGKGGVIIGKEELVYDYAFLEEDYDDHLGGTFHSFGSASPFFTKSLEDFNKLQSRTTFKYEDGIFTPVQIEESTWSLTDARDIPRQKFAQHASGDAISNYQGFFSGCSGNFTVYPDKAIYVDKPKERIGQHKDLRSTKTHMLTEAGNMEVYTENVHDFGNLSRKELTTSDGTKEVLQYKRLHHYSSHPLESEMTAKNMVSQVVETISYKNTTPNTIIGKSKTEYGIVSHNSKNLIVPIKEYTYNIENDQYVLAKEIIYKSSTKDIVVSETVSRSGGSTAYIWGYDDEYVVAKIDNATADEVGYMGFEDDATATEDEANAKTGKKYKTLNVGDLSDELGIFLADVESEHFVYSGWFKTNASGAEITVTGGPMGTPAKTMAIGNTNNEWEYKEFYFDINDPDFVHTAITCLITNQASSAISVDDLSLRPADALITTYTYDPLIGVTSITDPQGISAFYEYDGLGRLQQVKDNDGNILQHTNYNYKQ